MFGQSTKMGIGLVVFGLAGYLFIVLTGRTLSKSEANLATSLYFLINIIGPGIFYALEQLTSRSVSSAIAVGAPIGPAVRRVCRAGIVLTVAVLVILVACSPILVRDTLHGNWAVYLEVLATPLLYAVYSVVRGLLGGMQRFGGYAAMLTVEGAGRLLVCVLLVVVHAPSAWVFGIGFLVATALAMAVGARWLRGWPAGSTDRADSADSVVASPAGTALLKGLGALALAALCAQLLPNLAPLVVNSRLPATSATALAFAQAAVLARTPLLLFFPVQTMLLPNLSAAVARGEGALLARRIRMVLVAVAGLGVVCAAGFLLLGPWVLRTFLRTTTELPTTVMLLLVLSTFVFLAAYAYQPALVALGREPTVTLGWVGGSVVMLLFVLVRADPVTVESVAQVVGPAATLAIVYAGFRIGLRALARRGVAPQPDGAEQAEDEPSHPAPTVS